MRPSTEIDERLREARERAWRKDIEDSPPSAPFLGIVHGILISSLLLLLLIFVVQRVLLPLL